jgi:CRISPR/Cas system endoribonuclease Cas6 (RAMP superfamily)
MVRRTVNKRVKPTQEKVFGLWMHRLKRTETLERERKETEREGKQVTDQAPIRPTTQVSRSEASANRTVVDQDVKECSNEEGRNLFRTEAELEDRHNSGKSQEEKSNAARSYSGERAQAMGSQAWEIRNEESKMSNQSSEGPKQWKIKAAKCGIQR